LEYRLQAALLLNYGLPPEVGTPNYASDALTAEVGCNQKRKVLTYWA
jgi:hypothetical protein